MQLNRSARFKEMPPPRDFSQGYAKLTRFCFVQNLEAPFYIPRKTCLRTPRAACRVRGRLWGRLVVMAISSISSQDCPLLLKRGNKCINIPKNI